MECGWITDRQIEAARVAMTRSIKRGGKVWIRLFPDKPITKKPAETRMGKGKGAPEQWVARDSAGQDFVRDGRRGPRHGERSDAAGRGENWRSRPSSSAGTTRSNEDMKTRKSSRSGRSRARKQLREGAEQMFRLRFQMSMGQMDGVKKVRGCARSGRASNHSARAGNSPGAKEIRWRKHDATGT